MPLGRGVTGSPRRHLAEGRASAFADRDGFDRDMADIKAVLHVPRRER